MITQRLTKNPTKRIVGRRDGVESSGGDPYFAFVAYLQNTWALTDVTGKAGTLAGNAAIGTGNLVCDGTGDYLSLNAIYTEAFNFGNGDFTLEWYGSSDMLGSSFRYLFDCSGDGSGGQGWLVYFDTSNGIVLAAASDNALADQAAANAAHANILTAIDDAVDHYWAIVRDGTTVTLWLDGASYAFTNTLRDVGTVPFVSSEFPLWIGGNASGAGGYEYKGTLKNLRITNGIARDVSSVPTFPFPEA
jgi:hypothetical protein